MRDKWAIRESVWTALETARVVRGKSVHDKIPNFIGSEAAASLASELPEWEAARAIKSNPDQAQRPLRQLALEQGKLLYMAVPRLKDERGVHRVGIRLAPRSSRRKRPPSRGRSRWAGRCTCTRCNPLTS